MIPKFRVWDKQTGTIQEIESISFKEKKLVIEQQSIAWFNADYIRNFDDIELMQSRERVDKNNIEIFESDIVKNISGGYLGIIVIEDGAFKVKAKHSTFELTDNRCSGMVVVGNIYENPELLDEQR
ncbi:DNA-packaging protein [Enterococcus faecium]|nr:DNA-packaging protein [Enterococcus faecium]